MIQICVIYDWLRWGFRTAAARECLPFPVEYPAITPLPATPEIVHRRRINWYTSGYE